jgi:SAM-dependent methyltransferase
LNRTDRLLGDVSRTSQIVEIGAGYSPVAAKSAGWRTHVVDHASQAELRQKYATAQVDTGLIEAVDTIWRAGTLDEAVPTSLHGKVDRIIASHVLEHIPDLIGFLQAASRLVSPGGCLAIALPDRRYCFDCFRPWTTTGDLLGAHWRGAKTHDLRTAFDHSAYAATSGGQLAWGPQPVRTPDFMDSFDVAANVVSAFARDPDQPYTDYHAWQFTKSSFQLAILELRALGLCDWSVAGTYGPDTFEFFVELRRRPGVAVDRGTLQAVRRDLLLAQMMETREQIDFLLQDQVSRPIPTTDVEQKLSEQAVLLAEMAETLRWVRALLTPVRTVWRRLRGL